MRRSDNLMPRSERSGPPVGGRSEQCHHRNTHCRAQVHRTRVRAYQNIRLFIQRRQFHQACLTGKIERCVLHLRLNIFNNLKIFSSAGEKNICLILLNQQIGKVRELFILPKLGLPFCHRINGNQGGSAKCKVKEVLLLSYDLCPESADDIRYDPIRFPMGQAAAYIAAAHEVPLKPAIPVH